MYEWVQKGVQFTNMSPVFKGGSVTIAGLVALLFVLWMKQRWKEPLRGGFLVFIVLAVFVVLYGLFILIFRPLWWNPPY
jgi:phosphoglycerol transferase MdoB-like AlkP superfamily enzyme